MYPGMNKAACIEAYSRIIDKYAGAQRIIEIPGWGLEHAGATGKLFAVELFNACKRIRVTKLLAPIARYLVSQEKTSIAALNKASKADLAELNEFGQASWLFVMQMDKSFMAECKLMFMSLAKEEIERQFGAGPAPYPGPPRTTGHSCVASSTFQPPIHSSSIPLPHASSTPNNPSAGGAARRRVTFDDFAASAAGAGYSNKDLHVAEQYAGLAQQQADAPRRIAPLPRRAWGSRRAGSSIERVGAGPAASELGACEGDSEKSKAV
jgi:hypothetical protein